MKNRFLIFLFVAATVFAEDVKRTGPAPDPIAGAELLARTVLYNERDIVPVHAHVRFTTLIQLPKAEQILDYVCGDKEFWVVNGAQNFAYVKPAKSGSRTNLNLITSSGNVYSFVLIESADQAPDLKLLIEPQGDMITALNAAPKFVPASQIEDYKAQVQIAQAQVREAKQAAQAAVDREISAFRNEYPAKMKHVYRFARQKDPFNVTAIYHDDKFTYIQAQPQETPALYEEKDGKPNLVNFQFSNGMYVIDKILDNGYLAIGKQKLVFIREE